MFLFLLIGFNNVYLFLTRQITLITKANCIPNFKKIKDPGKEILVVFQKSGQGLPQ